MDVELIYRTVPLVSLALILLGWALIELLQTPRDEWDWLTAAIVFPGVAGALYLGSIGLNWSPIPIAWHDRYFESIRIVLIFTAPFVPVVWRNVFRAYRARRRGQYRRKVIYDLPQDERGA